MDLLTPWHLLIVAVVFVALFGAKRLPDAARSLGKSARILKTEMATLHDEHKEEVASEQPRVAVSGPTSQEDAHPVDAIRVTTPH
jgi:sec-independent protein translocase protein TatA